MSRKKYNDFERDKIKRMSNKLKQLLELKGLSQSDLCNKTSLAASTISDYVNGKTLISPSNLLKIATVLAEPVEFFTGEAPFSIILDRTKELGITLPELSERADVPLDFILSLESHVYPAKLDWKNVNKLAKVLEVSPGALYGTLQRVYIEHIPLGECPHHIGANKTDSYYDDLTEEEQIAVHAFISTYRQIKQIRSME